MEKPYHQFIFPIQMIEHLYCLIGRQYIMVNVFGFEDMDHVPVYPGAAAFANAENDLLDFGFQAAFNIGQGKDMALDAPPLEHFAVPADFDVVVVSFAGNRDSAELVIFYHKKIPVTRNKIQTNSKIQIPKIMFINFEF
jgi:hypothetical protein